MSKRLMIFFLTALTLGSLGSAWAVDPIPFTGNVDADFFIMGNPKHGVAWQDDNIGDSKGPLGGCLDEPLGSNSYLTPPSPALIPPSGFNLERVVWRYNCDTDTLFVGLDVCDERFSWDADCDGNILTANANGCANAPLRILFSDSVLEEYTLDIDVNQDGVAEATAGLRSEFGGLMVVKAISYSLHPDAIPRAANLDVEPGPVPADSSSQIPDVEFKVVGLRTAYPGFDLINITTRSGSTGDLVNEDLTLQEVPLSCACISITKEVSCSPEVGFGPSIDVLPGATVYFKITVTNCGNEELTNVVISDLLSSPNGACLGGIPPEIQVGNLAAQGEPGDSFSIVLPVQIDPAFATVGTPIDCTNTASVTAIGVTSGVEVSDGPESAMVNVLVPSIRCEKLANGASSLNLNSLPANVLYTLRVINTGEVPLNITIDDSKLGIHQAFQCVQPGASALAEKSISYPATSCGAADEVNTMMVTASTGECQSGLCGSTELRSECSATVRFPKCQGGATRTPGFWQTHWQLLQKQIQTCGPWNFGCTTATNVSDALALMWDGISRLRDGTKRTSLGQARMQLAGQLVAAYANVCAFGTPPPVDLAQAAAALAGTDRSAILAYKSILDAYNNSGDDIPFPTGFSPGSADPQKAQQLAATSTITQGACFR